MDRYKSSNNMNKDNKIERLTSKMMTKNATSILMSVDNGLADKKSHRNNTHSLYSPQRNGGAPQLKHGHSTSVFVTDKSNLVVNNDPDIPLKVPLEYSSTLKAIQVADLKQRNLERYEKVAQNLDRLAEQDRQDYLDKLKKEKKKMKNMEENYKNER